MSLDFWKAYSARQQAKFPIDGNATMYPFGGGTALTGNSFAYGADQFLTLDDFDPITPRPLVFDGAYVLGNARVVMG